MTKFYQKYTPKRIKQHYLKKKARGAWRTPIACAWKN